MPSGPSAAPSALWTCPFPIEGVSGYIFFLLLLLQSNLDGSNTDGLFTMANSNLFLSPYKILPIAQENKYLRKFSYFIVKLYVVCTH